jgi:deoxyadenosine/deoxycytidine kinase
LRDKGGIVIVGPCASGKSTLAEKLNEAGWRARQIAQEHSYVPSMWQQLSKPDFLIFLDASFETSTRRKSLNWTRQEYKAQLERLRHAREHCDLYLATDELSEKAVFERTMDALGGGQSPDQSL